MSYRDSPQTDGLGTMIAELIERTRRLERIGAGAVLDLPIGNNGEVLTLDNTAAGGLSWTPPGLPAFAVPAFGFGEAAAAGAAASVVRSDATLALFENAVSSTQAFGDAATKGTAAFAAHRDHKHGMPAAPVTTLDVKDEGVSVGAASIMDFVGAGVVASFAGSTATVTIAGGGAGSSGLSVQSWFGV